MQIRKVYQEVNPGLLYDEIKDFVQKQDVVIGEAKLVAYSMPSDSSSFIYRGTITFKSVREGEEGKEYLRAHIVGLDKGETKLIIDINEELFPSEKVSRLQEDLDFFFGSYEEEDD